ncbi:hypothetical protein EKO27_g1801 [Xylaria grammica]|uniref:Uncharacterized protein n=1 Tax=Xylaria grammica TaxID=363999 RepID=A0A439DFV4_9PEZI|nr:hypothetical protein EKO27_g1801 [Xylaria grammica]
METHHRYYDTSLDKREMVSTVGRLARFIQVVHIVPGTGSAEGWVRLPSMGAVYGKWEMEAFEYYHHRLPQGQYTRLRGNKLGLKVVDVAETTISISIIAISSISSIAIIVIVIVIITSESRSEEAKWHTWQGSIFRIDLQRWCVA